jgi:hypothetical protein
MPKTEPTVTIPLRVLKQLLKAAGWKMVRRGKGAMLFVPTK